MKKHKSQLNSLLGKGIKLIIFCFVYNSALSQTTFSKITCLDVYCLNKSLDINSLKANKFTESVCQDEYETWKEYTIYTKNKYKWIKLNIYDSINNEIVSIATNDALLKLHNGIRCGMTLQQVLEKLDYRCSFIYENNDLILFSCEIGVLFYFENIKNKISNEELNCIINNSKYIINISNKIRYTKLNTLKIISTEC